jgi:hypothetical protein
MKMGTDWPLMATFHQQTTSGIPLVRNRRSNQTPKVARKNGTSIHADAPNANEENQRGNRRVTTNPKMVPESESSKPAHATP